MYVHRSRCPHQQALHMCTYLLASVIDWSVQALLQQNVGRYRQGQICKYLCTLYTYKSTPLGALHAVKHAVLVLSFTSISQFSLQARLIGRVGRCHSLSSASHGHRPTHFFFNHIKRGSHGIEE